MNLAPTWIVDPGDGSPPVTIRRAGAYRRDDPAPQDVVDYGNGLLAEWRDDADGGRLFWSTDHVYMAPGVFHPSLRFEVTNPTTGQPGLRGGCQLALTVQSR